MFVIPEASLLWDLSWRSLVKILRIICRSGSCCKPSSGLGNKWRNQNGDKEEVTGKMLTKTYEVLGVVCIRQVPLSKASGSGKLTRCVCTRMMPMTTMMPMELNEGVDGGNPLTQPVLPPSCLNPLADACDDHEDEIGEKK